MENKTERQLTIVGYTIATVASILTGISIAVFAYLESSQMPGDLIGSALVATATGTITWIIVYGITRVVKALITNR